MAPKRKQPAEEDPHPVARARSGSDEQVFVAPSPKKEPTSSKKKKQTTSQPPPPPPPSSQPSPSSSKKSHKKNEKSSGKAEQTPKEVQRVEEINPACWEKSEDAKKVLFQRLWTEDDEIATLEGIVNFTAGKGIDPKDVSAHMVEFREHIEGFLHFSPSLSQLKDKVFRLKKKFGKVVRKKRGEDVSFSNPNDAKAFALWKRIWGGSLTGDRGVVESSCGNKNSNGEKEGEGKSEGAVKLGLSVDFAEIEAQVVKNGLDGVEGAKKAEMEEKWKQVQISQLEQFLKRSALVQEQGVMMLNSISK